MALVTITGFPCSGKSTRSQQLHDLFKAHLPPSMSLVIVSDDSLHLSRSSYSDVKLEKIARGTLLSNVIRTINPSTIVILDALNYIKGFRYQIYCAAREARVKMITVHVGARPDQCEEWDLKRIEHEGHPEQGYGSQLVKELIARYEEPKSSQRWDSPLFTITWEDEEMSVSSELARQILEHLTPPLRPVDSTTTNIAESTSTKGIPSLKPRHAATLPTSATSANALHTLDATCSNLIHSLMSNIASSPIPQPSGTFTIKLDLPHDQSYVGGGRGRGDTGDDDEKKPRSCQVQVNIPDSAAGRVNVAKLQRLKRGFLTGWKAIAGARAGHVTKGGGHESPEKVALAFAEYISLGLRN